jgi:hypothetical protein
MTTTTKNHKQQQLLHMLPTAAAPPWPVRTKLLLCAALGFALGVVATASLVNSPSYATSSAAAAALRGGGGALGLVLPPSATRNAAQDRRPPPKQAGAARATVRRSRPEPPAGTGITSAAAPPPSVVGAEGPAAPSATSRVNGGSIVSDSDGDDEELMARAEASAPREVPAGCRVPRVAFLFLARWDLPMAPLWDEFFRGHRGLYNVYVHSDPAFNGSDPPETSAFYRRRIPSKVRARYYCCYYNSCFAVLPTTPIQHIHCSFLWVYY